jgi:hypothetical protein
MTEKEEIIAAWEETIHHREDQINESDAIITQCNTIIEFLQEQIHDPFSRLMMPKPKSMNSNSSQYLLLYQPPKGKKKILKKSKESPESILSTEILLSVPIILLQAVSHQWATLMTFSLA